MMMKKIVKISKFELSFRTIIPTDVRFRRMWTIKPCLCPVIHVPIRYNTDFWLRRRFVVPYALFITVNAVIFSHPLWGHVTLSILVCAFPIIGSGRFCVSRRAHQPHTDTKSGNCAIHSCGDASLVICSLLDRSFYRKFHHDAGISGANQ